MKTKILLLTVIVLPLVLSCEKDEFIPDKPEQKVGEILVRSSGDGKNDLLGFGYDCYYSLGDNYRGSKNSVIDIDRYIKNQAIDPVTGQPVSGLPTGKIETGLLHGSSSQYEIYGSNLNNFYNSMSSKINLNSGGLLSWGKVSLTTEYDSSIDTKENHAFYKADLCRNVKRMSFNTYSPKRLKYYLTDDFIFALKEYTAKEIVDDYGTHVLSDIYVGGKLSVMVSAIQKSTINTDVVKFTNDVFNMITTRTTDSVSTQNAFRDLRFVLVQHGGKKVETIKKEITENGSIKYDIFDWSDWVNSVDETSSNLIYSDTETLIPIYEFIDDPKLKQEVIDEIIKRGAPIDPPIPQPETYNVIYHPTEYWHRIDRSVVKSDDNIITISAKASNEQYNEWFGAITGSPKENYEIIKSTQVGRGMSYYIECDIKIKGDVYFSCNRTTYNFNKYYPNCGYREK